MSLALKKLQKIKIGDRLLYEEDDPLEGINNRLEEIQSMVKPKADIHSFLEDLVPEQRDRILKITNLDAKTVTDERRKNWTNVDLLRHAFRSVYIMSSVCSPSRRYFNNDDPEAGPAVMRKQRQLYSRAKAQAFKSSLNVDLLRALQTNPEFRTPSHVKRVLWVLRATKAFKHLFPTEMEREVAKVVGYERYDDNRHLAYQGRASERFYYVLTGRIHRIREYRLSNGCVNKSLGYMSKGATSDPEELEQGWPRECHLVAKGPVEALIITKADFCRLQHTTQGPPIDFLGAIDLFKEFPCEQFLHSHDAIEYKYYGQNKVIARDVNRTPWLHVVKSGYVKVVRRQQVFDVRNDVRFSQQSTEELGCGRSFSHAKAMLGILAKQRKMKTMTDISLPDLMRKRSQVSIDDGMRARRKKHNLNLTNPVLHEIPTVSVHDSEGNSIAEDVRRNNSAKKERADLVLPPITQSTEDPTHASMKNGNHHNHDVNGHSGSSSNSLTTPTDDTTMTESPAALGHNLNQAHGTFLTREKTDIESLFKPKPPKKEQPLRRAYIQLDLLKPGDVFGLETLDLPTIEKFQGPALSLVSDGAEVVKISKRFFLQHAQNNTMLRVETMQRSYLSTDEAKSMLYDKETWSQYKVTLMKRLTNSLPR